MTRPRKRRRWGREVVEQLAETLPRVSSANGVALSILRTMRSRQKSPAAQPKREPGTRDTSETPKKSSGTLGAHHNNPGCTPFSRSVTKQVLSRMATC